MIEQYISTIDFLRQTCNKHPLDVISDLVLDGALSERQADNMRDLIFEFGDELFRDESNDESNEDETEYYEKMYERRYI